MDSIYYYMIWGFMGILLGMLVAAIVTFTFLHKKLQQVDENTLQDHATIMIIEERTRYLAHLPLIEERTRMTMNGMISIDKQITDKNPSLKVRPAPLEEVDGRVPTEKLKSPRVRA